MKKQLISILSLCLFVPFFAGATSVLEGNWRTDDGTKLVPISEFNGSVTMNTVSYYANGAAVNWFFEIRLPQGRDAQVGEVLKGRVRSVDGYYDCVFDEVAEAELQADGVLKVHFPLLTYHRRTSLVRDPRGDGYYYQHSVDWNGWSWVETEYGFPIEHYRVTSSECIIDQRNWVTNVLTKTNSPF